ncbi:DctP family TRAP transporter solute-binding subunit [Kurthia sibirica]|uniref:C4-dicarboxylate ABC transporter n=1 Tax=Kurthia sibirica TaxID=202750 RepID=A0A2U3AN69_9BACL|nr:DctP family TRAP transporter solute-binding subunit [Kurthia sibirica]PWI25939.1 C4-dicarboxylate ABC transporter [Kurthia sibirica]GEK35143.1 C4-dicarboxylate-binding protein DctB [Kurthia sibirica]
MRIYILTAVSVILLLIISIGYDNQVFQQQQLSTDIEQQGLEDQITLAISHVVAEDTPKGRSLAKFAELVEKYSDNSIQVKISPNGMLYNDHSEVQALIDNKVQMIAPTFSKMTAYEKSWEVLDLPFLFDNEEQVEKVLTSRVGHNLLNMLQQDKMLALGFWQNGFKQMIAQDGLLREPSDFQGLVTRVMPSTVLEEQFNLLKAQPIRASFDEVYNAIDTNSIKAMENTLSNIYSKGFYKKDRHITLSNHGLLGYAVIMNKDFFNRLNSKQQDAIKKAMADATAYNYKNAQRMNELSYQALQNENMHFAELTMTQINHWKTVFSPLYKTYKNSENAYFLRDIQSVLQQ